MHYFKIIIGLLLNGLLTQCSPEIAIDPNKYDLGNGEAMDGYTVLTTTDFFDESKGYGLFATDNLKSIGEGSGVAITSASPFYFSKRVEEGNYRVTVTLGENQGSSNTTIKAENRRLMVYDFDTGDGEQIEVSFLVHIRTPQIDSVRKVALKPRELNYLSWDDKLTLEFGGARPVVSAIVIEKAANVPVVFLAGNSTVVDQGKEPYGSWGQMFPLFFKDEVVIANHAESGETLRSFVGERRLAKVATMIKPGDYFFIEFAHNDQKPGKNQVEAFGAYQDSLLRFAKFAIDRGATPVFVTSTCRRSFDENGKHLNTLGDFPEAMRQLAKAENIRLIDLNALSKILFETLGPEPAKKAFVHFPANTFEDQPEAIADDTHFSTYGAYELAKCVVHGLGQTDLPLKKHLKELPVFHPEKPSDFADWKWPVSPLDELAEFATIHKTQ